MQHNQGAVMIFEWIEWDEFNLDHVTRRLTSAEIEQAIWNADRMSPNRGHQDWASFTSMTVHIDD